MKNKVSRMIREYHMISPGDHVICALSGGKDSMALLQVLSELRDSFDIRLSAAHFNHQLRGAESDRDEAFVKDWCTRQNVPLEIGRADVAGYARKRQLGIEEAARLLRYDFLEKLDPAAKIATAHTADDNLETVLMHMLRGCGLHGLTGIPPVRGRIIRPLLSTDTGEIFRYLEEHSVPHVEDSTNLENNALRNRLRHTMLPLFREEAPEIASRISYMCRLLSEDEVLLSEAADTAYPLICPGQHLLEISGLLNQPVSVQRRCLKRFLSDAPEVSSGHIEAVLALCSGPSPSGQLSLPGGYRVQRVYQQLMLSAEPAEKTYTEAVRLYPGQTVAFGHYRISCLASTEGCKAPEALVPIRPCTNGFYTLRSRQSGDRIHLRGGTKKVSRVMIDRKIPASIREEIPLLCDETQVLGILPDILSDMILPARDTACWYLQSENLEVSYESGR